MSVQVVCPFCSKELNSPDELVGKQVACPRCNKQFAISADGNGSSSGVGANVPAASAVSRSKFAPGFEPEAPPVQSPESAAKIPAESRPLQRPEKQPAAAKRRTVQSAKFVADGAVDSRLELGQDGQLPQLIASEDKQTKEVAEESEQDRSSWVLVGVLCFSVLMSVIMLLMPTGSQEATSDEKEEARTTIKEHYIGDGADIKPYQQLLRQALQAHNRDDEAAELRYYKRVLKMLHSEEHKEKGLTAPKWLSGSPNDRELEEQLSVLLR